MAGKRKRGIKFFFGFFAGLIFLIGTSVYAVAKCPTRMGSVFLQKNFFVIAHRGPATPFPENILSAFEEALQTDGANALEVDLSFTRDHKVVLWHDWNLESPNVPIPTFAELMEWTGRQDKLKLLLLKLQVPADKSRLAPLMLEEIRQVVGGMASSPRFEIIISTPHREVLSQVRNRFDDLAFSYDREISPSGIINYHRHTTIPNAIHFKNSFAGIGLLRHTAPHDPPKLDPWETYQYILTLDFRIRDDYRNRTSNYIKIISWTFNDEKKIRCLINLGVDGIVTDKPKMLRGIALDMGKSLD